MLVIETEEIKEKSKKPVLCEEYLRLTQSAPPFSYMVVANSL